MSANVIVWLYIFLLTLQEIIMDTTKWRTVAIRVEDFQLLKGLCEKKYRNPAAMIGKLVNDYITYLSKKEQIKIEKLKKQLMNGQKQWV